MPKRFDPNVLSVQCEQLNPAEDERGAFTVEDFGGECVLGWCIPGDLESADGRLPGAQLGGLRRFGYSGPQPPSFSAPGQTRLGTR